MWPSGAKPLRANTKHCCENWTTRASVGGVILVKVDIGHGVHPPSLFLGAGYIYTGRGYAILFPEIFALSGSTLFFFFFLSPSKLDIVVSFRRIKDPRRVIQWEFPHFVQENFFFHYFLDKLNFFHRVRTWYSSSFYRRATEILTDYFSLVLHSLFIRIPMVIF